jgi:hypothetical protein
MCAYCQQEHTCVCHWGRVNKVNLAAIGITTLLSQAIINLEKLELTQ